MAAILFFNKIPIKVFLSDVFVFRMICMIIYYNPAELYVSIHKRTTYAFSMANSGGHIGFMQITSKWVANQVVSLS